MGLNISERYENKSWVIEVEGDIDINSSNNLKIKLNEILDKTESSIVFKADALNYMDSTGIGVLISVLKRVKKNDNEIFIINPKKSISKLFNITGLNKVFKIVDESEDN